MPNNQLSHVIRSFDLFDILDDVALQEILQYFSLEHFPEKAVVIHQGDFGDKIYFIQKGKAQAYVINKQGTETVIGSLEKGDYFGELALISKGYRNCFVRTKTQCTLLSLSREKFNKILNDFPQLSYKLNKILGERLSETLHLVSEKKENIVVLMISSDSVNDRLKHFKEYFYKLCPRSTLTLDKVLPQEEFNDQYLVCENKYFLIQSDINTPEYLLNIATHIINFTYNDPEHINLTPEVTRWKIENTVRRILKKTVGIALCSGGAPGAAHIGVLKVLQEEGIPLDFIVGTSAGAIFGGGYALGYSIEEIIKAAEIMNSKQSYLTLLKYFGFKRSGIMGHRFYHKIFKPYFGGKNIEDTKIPFAAVASDLYTGDTTVLKTGDMLNSIIASCAAPFYIEPIKWNQQLLIDGVATDPLPVQVLIDEKIDIKIAVPIPQLDLNVSIDENPKLHTIYIRSRSMMAEQITRSSAQLADVIIEPQLEHMRMVDWRSIKKATQAGEVAAKLVIKRLRYLLEGF